MVLLASVCAALAAFSVSRAELLGTSVTSHAGTFENPSVIVRPKFRYWLPDASIDTRVLASDIAQLAQRGAGGIELLNYFNYGGAQGPPPDEVDWNLYGYGTDAYRQVLEAALQAAKGNGLIMDFSLGPQSGQGVPAEPDDVGLSWELVSFNTSFTGEYRGQVPGWGAGDFISASAFNVLNSTIVPALSRPDGNKTEYTISASSLVDLTSLVSSNGSISFSSDLSHTTNSTLLFTTYARRSYARANIASSENPQNILQNGSFAVDHFSRAGAKLTTSFLESHVIQPDSIIRHLFKQVGQYIWEDSPEVPSPIYWTPNLPSVFKQQHGYDIQKYIPFLTGFNGDLMLNDPLISIVSDGPQHLAFVDEFRTTLTGLYKEYLTALKDWSNDYLGMEFSAQVGYNLPVDMLSSIPAVDVPETETLSFLNNIDAFRQFSGPASLAGQKIVSIELGADFGQAYSQPLAVLIEEASRTYVAGINQVVIHGASYSGNYPRTTYPGFATFGYQFAAQHSRHQPAWNLGYESMLDWLARAQFVLQSGVPKVDVVFWNKQTAQDPFPDPLYENTDLIDAGYSYTYLSPDNFALPAAIVEGGLLAPETLGAKVLVLRHNDTLTTFGVQTLAEYANAGLSIIIEGGISTRYSTSNVSAAASANSTLYSILDLPNVHQLSSDPSSSEAPSVGLASLLKSLNIKPRTSIQTDGTWYTRYLSSSTALPTSVFVFSDTATATEGTISVTTTGRPYLLDLWNGVESPILEYRVDEENGILTIPIRLSPKQAKVIQFKDVNARSYQTGSHSRKVHVTNAPKNILGYAYDPSTDSVIAKLATGIPNSTNATNEITLSDNTTIDVSSSTPAVPAAFNLSDWTLVAEKWLPPSNLSDVNGVVKVNVTVELQGSEIPAWPNIEGLANSSGIGTYTTTFTWPPSSYSHHQTSLGAFLQIPATVMIQGLTVFLNGHVLPKADLFDPTLDITSYLRRGSNSLSISVSTTLWNSLRPIWDEIKTGGVGPQMTIELLMASPLTMPLGMELPIGLAGLVQIVPYSTLKIA